jgi:hypothetical protein
MDHNDPFLLGLTYSKIQNFGDFRSKRSKRDYPLFTTHTLFSIILKKRTMEENKEVFILDLPNIGNDDVIKLTEQLILQSDKLMDGYRIETNNLIVDIIVKKN